MASTATTRGRLEKQGSGENENTWGDKTNTNLDLIDEWIGGYLSKSVAGASDVTLTNTDYVSNEARQRLITLTGVLTGNINVIVPTAEGYWTFYNNTSGSFTLTVKTSAGTGIAIPQGYYADLYCDGTNVLETSARYLTTVRATTIELGAATDTTIARVSAGRISVEGSNVLMASDLGTNVSTLLASTGAAWTAFTPTLLFGGSATGMTGTFSGRYLRFANTVFYEISITLTAKGTSTGDAVIGSLPVSAADPTNVHSWPVAIGYTLSVNLDVAGGYYSAVGLISESTTNLSLFEIGDNVSPAALTDADFGNASRVRIQGWYEV